MDLKKMTKKELKELMGRTKNANELMLIKRELLLRDGVSLHNEGIYTDLHIRVTNGVIHAHKF